MLINYYCRSDPQGVINAYPLDPQVSSSEQLRTLDILSLQPRSIEQVVEDFSEWCSVTAYEMDGKIVLHIWKSDLEKEGLPYTVEQMHSILVEAFKRGAIEGYTLAE